MRTFAATQRWRMRWPGAVCACLVLTSVTNPASSLALERRVDSVEQTLRERYSGLDRAAMRAMPPFDAYDRYYKHFGQNFHVLHQIESVALKGKPIPRRAALVEAAFVEELQSGLLTAMHDADVIGPDIVTDAALGAETYTLYNGKEATLDPDDMFMRDSRGILTSVIKGPAAYALATPETTAVAVCVYAPSDIGPDRVATHLEAIAANMLAVSGTSHVELLEIVQA